MNKDTHRSRMIVIVILCILFFLGGVLIGRDFIKRFWLKRENTVNTTNNTHQNAQYMIFQSRQNAIVRATQKVAPCVVGIVVTHMKIVGTSYYFEDFFGLFLKPKMIPKYKKVHNMGSGIIINKKGIILTNNHVVDGALQLFVNFSDGRKLEGEVIGQDPYTDLAVIAVNNNGKTFPTIEFGNSDSLMLGEWAIAIGNPFMNFDDAQPTVTVGVISALNRNFTPSENVYYQNMIQTDAAINPGNSGGPLVSALGKVIGINSFIYSYSGTVKNSLTGIGFAIPINRAEKVAKELIQYGKRREVWTGIFFQDVDTSISNENDPKGIIITKLEPNSPAIKSGLKINDIIVQFGDRGIISHVDLDGLLLNYFPGDTIRVVVKRDKEILKFDMVLETSTDDL